MVKKKSFITNEEYEKRLINIDQNLNKPGHSKTIYIKLEYAKKNILETLYNREIIKGGFKNE